MENSRYLNSKKSLRQSPPPIDFNQFVNGLKDISEKGKKIADVLKGFQELQDSLEAVEILDNKEIKEFGNYGAHIIVPSKYAGKKAKVIIKK